MQESKLQVLVGAVILLLAIIGGIYVYVGPNEIANYFSDKKDAIVAWYNNEPYINTRNLSDDEKLSKYNEAMNVARQKFNDKKYNEARWAYLEAKLYMETEGVYAGLYTVYTAQEDWVSANFAVDQAIRVKELNADYWKWKLSLRDERFEDSFEELDKIYTDAQNKIDPRQRINLATHFARIAEGNGKISRAIELLEDAKEWAPDFADTYQQEIDRLEGLLELK